jgi:acyl transferase domain-containing protein
MPRLKSYWSAKANATMTPDQCKASAERYAAWQHQRDLNSKASWNASCVERARQWALDHPEEAKERRRKAAAARKARRMSDPEYLAKYKAQKKKHKETRHLNHPRAKRTEHLKTKGWTLERYDSALHEQDNCCAICREPFPSVPCADHKHCIPPVPRALLCGTCNSGLGMFRDQPELLEAAAAYLRKFSQPIGAGSTVHEPGCVCGFCKMGATRFGVDDSRIEHCRENG